MCIHIYLKKTFLRCHWWRHDDVIKWRHFPRYWPFVRGIHRSPVNSPHKGQWRGALMFSLICARINRWTNNRKAGDLRRCRSHCDVIVMYICWRSGTIKHRSTANTISYTRSQLTISHQWHYNERNGVSSHRRLDCLLNCFFRRPIQSKYQSSASLAFFRGIHRWPVNSPHKGPVMRKRFPFDDVIIVQIKAGR